ncbi:prolyl oligopeptidase family serine peptidase [uncultured Microscilla sp.]|uniref:S9 family peptidase n=1 Tax=uncultured Microscilla sp. TaxID=432653 RepID=UPI002627D990|nr:prolyl oligopeptidase family serine peptidase [uncultured Microscilla sp.]
MKQLLVVLAMLLTPMIYAQKNSYTLEEYMQQTNFSGLAVSPNGRYVVVVTRKNDLKKDKVAYQMWRITLDKSGNKQEMIPLTKVSFSAFYSLKWAPNNRYLSFRQGEHLYTLDMTGGEAIKVNNKKMPKGSLTSYAWLPQGSNQMCIAITNTKKNPEAKKVKALYGKVKRRTTKYMKYTTTFYKVNYRGKVIDSLFSIKKYAYSLLISPSGKKMVFSTYPISQRKFSDPRVDKAQVYIATLDQSLVKLKLLPKIGYPLMWGSTDNNLISRYSMVKGADSTAITQTKLHNVSVDKGKTWNLSPQFKGHYREAILLDKQQLLAIGDLSTRRNFYLIDTKKQTSTSLTSFKGVATNLAASQNRDVLVFVLTTNKYFKEVYLAKGYKNLKKPVKLTSFNDSFAKYPAPTIQKISWDNGEGDQIEGVLIWPPNLKNKKNLSLVVDIHGGPWSARYETVTMPFSSGLYYNYASYMAMNNYLVLLPNYRGGVGRGDKFLRDLNGYSISRPCTDILKGVEYVIKQGWANPNSLAVMGISYGGLLTNALITKTNQFKVALSTAGSWNSISYFGASDNLSQTDVRFQGKRPWQDLKRYWKESPMANTAKITTPTLIMFGENDRRVPVSQGYEMFKALYTQKVPCELVLFPKEGHFWQSPVNQFTKIKIEMNWLNHYLKGKPLVK